MINLLQLKHEQKHTEMDELIQELVEKVEAAESKQVEFVAKVEKLKKEVAAHEEGEDKLKLDLEAKKE